MRASSLLICHGRHVLRQPLVLSILASAVIGLVLLRLLTGPQSLRVYPTLVQSISTESFLAILIAAVPLLSGPHGTAQPARRVLQELGSPCFSLAIASVSAWLLLALAIATEGWLLARLGLCRPFSVAGVLRYAVAWYCLASWSTILPIPSSEVLFVMALLFALTHGLLFQPPWIDMLGLHPSDQTASWPHAMSIAALGLCLARVAARCTHSRAVTRA